MTQKRPNILLVVVDCLRADKTLAPTRSAKTTNIDALKARGAAFSHLITVNSVTIPCMTSMLSSLYPANHGVRGMAGYRIPDKFPLLAEILREAGYRTYAEVTSPLGEWLRLNRGFDEYHMRQGVKQPFVGEWGDQFIARFKNNEFKEPWFAYLHLWEVHQPRYVLPEYNHPEYGDSLYDRAISGVDAQLGKLIEAVDENTIIIITGDHGEKIPDSKIGATLETRKNKIKDFLSRILPQKGVNTVLGFITKTWYKTTRLLHRGGVIKSSLASLTGHGYHVYDIFVRVPLIIAGPNIPALNKTISEQVRQIDIFPTILDLAGLSDKTPTTIDGRSFAPLLRGETIEPQHAFLESWVTNDKLSLYYGIRTPKWKYAYNPDNPENDEELYDLQADPEEKNNIFAQHPEIIAQMRSLAHQHFNERKTEQDAHGELSEEESAALTKQLQDLGYLE